MTQPPEVELGDEIRRIAKLRPTEIYNELIVLAERVEQPSDLTAEQKIRDYALEHVTHRHECNGDQLLLSRLFDEADDFAEYIRTGAHPKPEPVCTCDQVEVTPYPGAPRETVPGTPDPACPEHGSRLCRCGAVATTEHCRHCHDDPPPGHACPWCATSTERDADGSRP